MSPSPTCQARTMQERLRTMLLEMPLSRAEIVVRTGWSAKQADRAIGHAMRNGYVVPLRLQGRTRRSYVVPGFVPSPIVFSGVPLSDAEQQILQREMQAVVQA